MYLPRTRSFKQCPGTIPIEQALRGRSLCRRNVFLQDQFQERLETLANRLLGRGHRWLAVHIRRGDKACESKINFELSDSQIATRIMSQYAAWRCSGVFLCSDDAPLKKSLEASLSLDTSHGGPGIVVLGKL